MFTPDLAAAFILGVAGSMHCLGMCGPIALSLPVGRFSPAWRPAVPLLYNLGRLLTYSLLGLIAGLLGSAAGWFGWQQTLSVVAGVVLLMGVLFPVWSKRLSPENGLMRITRSIQNRFGALWRSPRLISMLGIGALNGLLPCGLVYLGLAGALVEATPAYGSLFMVAFALGTWPAMLALPVLGQWITPEVRLRVRRAVPWLVAVMGTLLILRGLGLDIPYVSPALVTETGVAECH